MNRHTFTLTDIKTQTSMLHAYYMLTNGGFDDYFEDKVLAHECYSIQKNSKQIGLFTISKEGQLTSFYLQPADKNLYAEILSDILTFHNIQGIVTITNDALMMTELLRRNFTIVKQAYNFKYYGTILDTNLNMRQATDEDLSIIKEKFGYYIEDYSSYSSGIKQGNVYLGIEHDQVISLGNIVQHKTAPEAVSIGMIVASTQSNKGYGTETIKAMINIGLSRGSTVQAGCWFYNHASKKTLEKAGMAVCNMIVRVDSF